MEVVIDWVIKVTYRIPIFANWMQTNLQSWIYLIEWLKENSEPPSN